MKALKTQLHHWWPRTLSMHWQAEDGMVSAIRSDGSLLRSAPGNFGGITNAHHIKIGGPWDSTFEPLFNQADSEMSDVIAWMATLEATHADPLGPILPRIQAQGVNAIQLEQLARTMASLVARSPQIRNTIRITIEHHREGFGLKESAAPKALIAANQHGLYDAYRKRLELSGRWAVLFTDNIEFISGDGFLHNFPSSVDGFNSNRKSILPLTPEMCLAYILPMHYPSDPKLVTIRLSDHEVHIMNEFVQIYSSDFLFFRSQKPEVFPHFFSGGHLQLKYHQHEWLDRLLDDLSQYNHWGGGGKPSRCQTSPFSEAIEMEKMLDNLLESRQ